MNIDFDYLATIPKAHPNANSLRWGCSFDGRQMALVGYMTEPNGVYRKVKNNIGLLQGENAVVFYAALLPSCTITKAVRVMDRISTVLNQEKKGLVVYVEGALGRNEIFIRNLRKTTPHKVKLFREGQGAWFDQLEVVAAIADDQEEGRLNISPSFKTRPERVLLDEATSIIEDDLKMNPLQSAFVYGVGHWSCKEQRRKFSAIAPAPRFW